MRYVVYVDSLYGSDAFSGDIDSPVRTMSYALSIVYEGGVIVLQTGIYGSSYGAITINKNVTIRAAYGASPYIDTITIMGAQGSFEGLSFSKTVTPGLTKGISVTNTGFGSVIVRDCLFDTVDYAIDVKNAQYLSVHRNKFIGHKSAIKVDTAQEVCISSNVFDSGLRSIEVTTVDRVDTWGNTIYGAGSVAPSALPDQNLRVLYKTLTAFDITYKRIQLPTVAYMDSLGKYVVAINAVNGSSFEYGVDYTVVASGSIVSWSGYAMESLVVAGDILRIMYNEGADPGGGEAIRLQNIGDHNSRVDSNIITKSLIGSNISIGVYFNTPVKIRHNNLYGVDSLWLGSDPYGETGTNYTGMDPTSTFRDPSNSDFHLNVTSLAIDMADPGRWSNVYQEMGVVNIDGRYTGSAMGTRRNVAPFDRSLDFDYYNRGVTGMVGTTGDLGAYEFNQHETAMGNYVAEQGYDIAHPGSATSPYATLDRGYARAGNLDLYVNTNVVPIDVGSTGVEYTGVSSGSSYGRYHSKNIVLSNSTLTVGYATANDIAYVYPSYPAYETGAVYVAPDSGTGVTGSSDNPYRTIGDAVTSGSSYILVRPGFYPKFKGESGVHLVGVAETRNVPLNSELYSNLSMGSWTGMGLVTGSGHSLLLTDNVDTFSVFGFTPPVDSKFSFSVTGLAGTFYGGIDNTANRLYAGVDCVSGYLIIGYRTALAGETAVHNYESYFPFTGSLSNIKAAITLNYDRFRISVGNDMLSNSYTYNLGSNYTGIWNLFYYSQMTGACTVCDMQLYASSFTGGVSGVSSTYTRRKVFGIMGATGIATAGAKHG